MESTRQLAAIMFTDISGYTKLMQRSESAAMALRERHRSVFTRLTDAYDGRVINYYGDGTLSIFTSTIKAVQCAADLQAEFQKAPVVPLRIGIHTGDIIVTEDDIIGDSVNLTSRVESLGVPGAIMISETVMQEIKNQDDLPVKFLGNYHFKNVDKEMGIYSLALPGLSVPSPKEVMGKLETSAPKLTGWKVAVLFVLLVIVGFVVDRFVLAGASTSYQSMAVLPLTSLLPDSDQDYVLEGVHYALISELQRAGLAVKARTSMLQYRDTEKAVKRIARELGVQVLIEGTVYAIGDSLQIELGLIDGRTEEYIWSRAYKTNLRDIESVYHGLVQNIADEIQFSLAPQEKVRLGQNKSINPEAYKAYLRGQNEWFKLTPESINSALAYFEKVKELDAEYAPAYAGIASVWVALLQQGLEDPEVALPHIEENIAIAVALDSSLPEVYYTKAHANWATWNWPAVAPAFEKAIELNPNYAEALGYYAVYLVTLRQFDRGIQLAEKVLEIDPFQPLWQGLNGMVLNFSGQSEKVVRALTKTLESNPKDPIALSTIKTAYHILGRYDDAYEIWERTYEFGKDTFALQALRKGYAEGGYHKALQRLAEMMIERSKTTYVTPWRIATMYTRAGMGADALDWLEKAFEEHDSNMPFINVDPIFDFLREEPRFVTLVTKINLPG